MTQNAPAHTTHTTPATTAIRLKDYIRPGDTIMWGQFNAEPLALTRALVEQRQQLGRVRVFPGISNSPTLKAEYADALDFISYAGGGNRDLARAGVLDILPSHYSHITGAIRNQVLPVDVLLLQLSPPDAQGRYSLGLSNEYLIAALEKARVVIGEVNAQTPWTHGERSLTRTDLTALVNADYGPQESAPARLGEAELAIGRHIAERVPDGATLQLGIGSIPEAVLHALRQHRALGVHSGALGDQVAELMRQGVITNEHKNIDRGITIGGILMGSKALHEFAHQNPQLALRGTDYTHGPATLAQHDQLVAINSAIEVDLTGQVNAEVAGGTYLGAVGGALDFLRAAANSRGGLPIIALPATAGTRSRIVAELSGPVSTPRSDAGLIVTEFGVADLRGQSLSRRVERMIAIAHPDHRTELSQQADKVLGAVMKKPD